MSKHEHKEPLTEEELQHLQHADDPEYWDYLDKLEYELGGPREWDFVVGGSL